MATDTCLITTICGSTKFKREIEEAGAALERSGYFIVFRPQFFAHADGISLTEYEMEQAKELHRFKIRESNVIHVVNPGGYIGESTQEEISYAFFNERDIYLEVYNVGVGKVMLDILRRIPAKIRLKYRTEVNPTSESAQFQAAFCVGGNEPIFI